METHVEEGRLITGEILLKGSRNFESFNEQFAKSTKEDRAESYTANIMIQEKRTPSGHQIEVRLSILTPFRTNPSFSSVKMKRIRCPKSTATHARIFKLLKMQSRTNKVLCQVNKSVKNKSD